jgi:hypothetical protein
MHAPPRVMSEGCGHAANRRSIDDPQCRKLRSSWSSRQIAGGNDLIKRSAELDSQSRLPILLAERACRPRAVGVVPADGRPASAIATGPAP